MIYAMAAYTITLGVLALYGVMLQHRSRVFLADQDTIRDGGAQGLPRGFNLGAALLSPFWMWTHGMRLPGAIMLGFFAALVPLYDGALWLPMLFVGMVPLAAGAALGLVGNRIAIAHRGPESVASFSSSQLPWALMGIVLFTIVLPWVWYFVYASA